MSRVTSVAILLFGCGGGAAPDVRGPLMLGGQEISGETLARGERLYRLYCASCHGVDGSGRGGAAAAAGEPRDFRGGIFVHKSTPGDALPTHADLVGTIASGVPERGMPGFRGFQPEDLDALAHYLKTFSPRWREGAPE